MFSYSVNSMNMSFGQNDNNSLMTRNQNPTQNDNNIALNRSFLNSNINLEIYPNYTNAVSMKRNVSCIDDEQQMQNDESFHSQTKKTKSKRVKLEFDSANESVLNNSNMDNKQFQCEFCSNSFANPANLRQHIEAFHMRTSVWMCSECKKMFTSKSNLKVHLRVHTRIKPYHCKSCSYSCMHHSSIKEHLSRIHPGVVHSSANPAYVFNSTAVPDPEQFNSASFDRDAFIAEAKETNNKIIAQMSTSIQNKQISRASKQSSSVNISPISNTSSSSSNYVDMNQEEVSNEHIHSSSISSNDEHNDSESEFNTENNYKPNFTNNTSINANDTFAKYNPNTTTTTTATTPNVKPKYTCFSISSLINENNEHEDNKSQINKQISCQYQSTNQFSTTIQSPLPQQQQNQQQHPLNSSYQWAINNQLHLFYTYLYKLHLNQQQS